jgi:phospho-N-acetylmuramoyl-pentapeptide-transferase
MIRDTIWATMIAFVSCAILIPLLIPALHKLKFGQQVRDCGPKAHLKKSGTPTMGGIAIVISVIIGMLPCMAKYPFTVSVIIFMLTFGLIGFLDDILKIRKKKSEGLKAWQKLLMQLVATGIFAFYLYSHPQIKTGMLVPFTGGMQTGIFLHLGIWFIPAVFVIVLGTDNGVNFTDGLDGLCASVTIAVSLFFLGVAVKENIPTAPVAGAMTGSLLGFLLYNVYPAKIFMGDTGSLALGGYVASLALVMQMPLFIVTVGFIYLIEVLSVIIQVAYFRKTHGKRFFRMAPLHHHFELGGWSETRVVAVFTIVTVILGMFSFIGMM